MVSNQSVGQKSWSEMTYARLALGYFWRPKLSPNAEFPSTRSPRVRKSRSLYPSISWRKNPAFVWVNGSSVGWPGALPPDESVGTPGPAKSLVETCVQRWLSRKICPPHENVDLSSSPNGRMYEPA